MGATACQHPELKVLVSHIYSWVTGINLLCTGDCLVQILWKIIVIIIKKQLLCFSEKMLKTMEGAAWSEIGSVMGLAVNFYKT